MNVIEKFAAAWANPDCQSTRIKEEELNDLEKFLNVRFPEEYRTPILSTGLPSPTIELWDWLDAQEEKFHWQFWKPRPHFWHLSDFHTPKEIKDSLEWRKAGLPDDLLPFANDSMGNSYCFSLRELANPAISCKGIYFWDHDFGTVTKLGRDFKTWLLEHIP